jgi:tRNA pseudouridine13 synthase
LGKFMLNDPPPYQTHGLPGIGGRIKEQPEDFEVEEIPAYEPSGDGCFLYLWIEKRDLGAEYFARQLAQRLGIRADDVGTAGLKDRRAVTRQWVSVPDEVEPKLAQAEGDGIRVLKVSRHNNKLKPGHLHGNRFRIRIRGVEQPTNLAPILQLMQEQGMANFYGEQRFGKEGETLNLGLKLLRGEQDQRDRGQRFLRKLALSAVQSALFNRCLDQRLQEGLLYRVLLGDVLAKWPFGGMFNSSDVVTDQARFDRRELVSAGPMFGIKMFKARDEAALRESRILKEEGLSLDSFAGFGKLLAGTRRHNLIYLSELATQWDGDDLVLQVSLPAGSYATVLLREIIKPKDDASSATGDVASVEETA